MADAGVEGAARDSPLMISGGTGDQDELGDGVGQARAPASLDAAQSEAAGGLAASSAPITSVAEPELPQARTEPEVRPAALDSPLQGEERGRSKRQSSKPHREGRSWDRREEARCMVAGSSQQAERAVERVQREARVSIMDSQEATPRTEWDAAAAQVKATREAIDQLLSNPESSQSAMFIHYVIVIAILASTASCIVETLPSMRDDPIFFPLEMCITALFTIEFALRLYASNNMLKFFSSFYNIIDFIAIFPGYLELVGVMIAATEDDDSRDRAYRMAGSTKTLRIIRLIRIVRVMKFARHSRALGSLFKILNKVTVNSLVVVVMLMGFATVLSASLIYLFESEHCQDTGLDCTGPSAFESIPRSFWWAIATLTTVGYGDMVPHTFPGKIIGGCTAMLGLLIVAIAVSLVTLNIKEVYTAERHRAIAEKDTRRRGSGRYSMDPTQLSEVDQSQLLELFRQFEHKSEDLLAKLRRDMSPFEQDANVVFDSLVAHKAAFAGDVRRFMTAVLGMDVDESDCETSQESTFRRRITP